MTGELIFVIKLEAEPSFEQNLIKISVYRTCLHCKQNVWQGTLYKSQHAPDFRQNMNMIYVTWLATKAAAYSHSWF